MAVSTISDGKIDFLCLIYCGIRFFTFTVLFRAKRTVTCHKGLFLAAFRWLSQVADPPSACDISNRLSLPIFPALRAANPSALVTLSQAVTDPSAHPLCNFLSHVTGPSALGEEVLYCTFTTTTGVTGHARSSKVVISSLVTSHRGGMLLNFGISGHHNVSNFSRLRRTRTQCC